MLFDGSWKQNWRRMVSYNLTLTSVIDNFEVDGGKLIRFAKIVCDQELTVSWVHLYSRKQYIISENLEIIPEISGIVQNRKHALASAVNYCLLQASILRDFRLKLESRLGTLESILVPKSTTFCVKTEI